MHFRDVLRAIPRNGDSPSVRRVETNLHISKGTSWLRDCDEIGEESPPPHLESVTLEFKTHLPFHRAPLRVFRYILIGASRSFRASAGTLRICGRLLREARLEVSYFI